MNNEWILPTADITTDASGYLTTTMTTTTDTAAGTGQWYFMDDNTWQWEDKDNVWLPIPVPNIQPTWAPQPIWSPPPIGDLDWLKDIFTPVECTCCGELIKVQTDGLNLKIGDKIFWFHRQCFAHRKYASFIRSLIITEDLGIL